MGHLWWLLAVVALVVILKMVERALSGRRGRDLFSLLTRCERDVSKPGNDKPRSPATLQRAVASEPGGVKRLPLVTPREGGDSVAEAGELPYQRAVFVRPAERSFLVALDAACGSRYRVMAKVRLLDLIEPRAGLEGSEYQSAKNRVRAKHVDFVLCAPDTYAPALLVELDGRSHRRRDRIARDLLVDRIAAAAGLRVLHVARQRTYRTEDLAAQVSAALEETAGGGPAPAAAPVMNPTAPPAEAPGNSSDPPPNCPRCQAPMVRRQSHRGGAATEFWGCPNYPECRGTRDLK